LAALTSVPVLHAVVRGRVQGVGFRWFVRERARELGVRGWVRNRADGSVEVEAAGESESLDRFRQWLSRGPSGAHVSRLDDLPASAGSEAELPNPFAIVR
jgi:acylphosphatase